MRAMILAAGRGERMRPLTDHLPKPLLEVGGQPLIVWHLQKLAKAGISKVVINHAWLGEKLEAALGNGNAWGVNIQYSAEAIALETAGGIVKALAKLGEEPFLVLNGDVWCDWDPLQSDSIIKAMTAQRALAWLLLVPNPDHHLGGDFSLTEEGSDQLAHVRVSGSNQLTFSGIGIYNPRLFDGLPDGQAARLAPLLRQAMARKQVIGSRFEGAWFDIGTPERLQALDRQLLVTPKST